MNVEARPLRTKAEQLIVAEYRVARARLPGGDAIRARRDAAFALFERAGLPHRRVEAWKYTDLRALMTTFAPRAGTAPAEALAIVAERDPIASLDRAQIVVANGVYREEFSDLAGAEGVTVRSLVDVLASEPERVGRLFADSDDPIIALNTAMMAGGVFVTVAPDAKPGRPIEIVHLNAGASPIAVFTRDIVSVGANASVRFVESHRGPNSLQYQVNALTELDVGRGARVLWARLQTEGANAEHLATFICRVAADSTLDHLAVNAGAVLARWQGRIVVAGRGARVGMAGATMLAGTEHGDTWLEIIHAEPGSVSREMFKSAVDGRSEGAFQGRIVVQPEAQKTDAKMMTKALLLSDEAQFAAKPELEIFADDVQCGHGATSGRIDESLLFYLMARGVPRLEAERLLVEAFLDEAIDAIGDADIAEALKGTVSAWLAKRGGRS